MNDLTYPDAERAWVHGRGLTRTLMDWAYPAPEDHDEISPTVWQHVVTQLGRMHGRSLPEVLTVASAEGERLVPAERATREDMSGALLTSLATACRLYEALLNELDTAAGLRRRLAESPEVEVRSTSSGETR